MEEAGNYKFEDAKAMAEYVGRHMEKELARLAGEKEKEKEAAVEKEVAVAAVVLKMEMEKKDMEMEKKDMETRRGQELAFLKLTFRFVGQRWVTKLSGSHIVANRV